MSYSVTLGQIYPATKKVFHNHPYKKDLEANVIAIKDGHVVLDKTIFYAESGGQDFDTGFINNTKVVNVQDQLGQMLYLKGGAVEVPSVKVDTIIVHKIEGETDFCVGETVKLMIDWDRRYKLMRNHSASHFLFFAANAIAREKIGEKLFTKGCHISVDGARFDFSYDIPSEWIPDIEALANEQISRGLEIEMKAEPESTEIFYWTYGDDIIIPCGGTHVKSATELGKITVKRRKQGKGTTRLGFDGVAGE